MHFRTGQQYLNLSASERALYVTGLIDEKCRFHGAFFDVNNSRRVSFDHLVGEREQIIGDHDAERLGGFEIDDEFEFRGLNNRQIGRLCTL
jgi:hypothetical protein